MNNSKSALIIAAFISHSFHFNAQVVTDVDGNVYSSVIIGTQKWLQQDLKVRHYNNGDSIQYVIDTSIANNLTTGAYFMYNNDTAIANTYGNLYNGFAIVDNRKICPAGWHVPSQFDWAELANYLGGYAVAGGKLKEAGTSHWLSPNTGATNSSGFFALPGGEGHGLGSYYSIQWWARWWSSSPPLFFCINYSNINLLYDNSLTLQDGYSVRCICDTATAANQINERSLNNQIEIKIYPSPAYNTIAVYSDHSAEFTITFYNSLGEFILEKVLMGYNNEIDISTLETGIYFIQVSGANRANPLKIVKK